MTALVVNQPNLPTLTVTMRRGVTEENQVSAEDVRLAKKVVEFTKILPELAELVVLYRNSSRYDCFPVGTVIRPSNSLTLPRSWEIENRNIFSPCQVFLCDGPYLMGMIDLNSLKLTPIKHPAYFDVFRGTVDQNTFIHINSKGRLIYSALNNENELTVTANVNLQNLEEDDFESFSDIFDIRFFYDTPMKELIIVSKKGDVLVSRSPLNAKEFYNDVTITKTGKNNGSFNRIVFAKSLPERKLVLVNYDSISVWNTSTNKLEHESFYISNQLPEVSFTSHVLEIKFSAYRSICYSLPTCEIINPQVRNLNSTPENRPYSVFSETTRPNNSMILEMTIFSEDFGPRSRCQLSLDYDDIILNKYTRFSDNHLIVELDRLGKGTVLHSFKFENTLSKRSNNDTDSKTNEPPKSHLERYADDSKTNEPPLPRLTISSTTHDEQIEED